MTGALGENVATVTNSLAPASEESSSSYLSWLKRPMIQELDLFLFGMTMILGAQFNTWNTALQYGYWLTFTNLLYLGSTYVCLCLCLSEMSSALPFSGGIFGFARAIIGPFYGYIVACFELLLNISYVTFIVYQISQIPIALGAASIGFQVFLIVLAFVAILIICMIGGKVFWSLNAIFGVVTIALVLMYLLGALINTSSSANFQEYSHLVPFTFFNFASQRQEAVSAYLGVQYIPLFSESLKNPKEQIPRVLMSSIFIYVISVISLMTAACSQYPGAIALSQEAEPLQYGFAAIFRTTWKTGVWMSFPPMFASSLTFVFCCGRQLHSIAHSGLIPKVFTRTIPELDTPWVGVLFSVVICMMLTLFGTLSKGFITLLQNVASISSQFVFINALIAYIYFHYNLSELNRSFKNPLGIYAAIWAIISYSLGLLSTCLFKSKSGYIAVAICAVYLVCAVIFYYVYMVNQQIFSAEEKKLMFKAYLVNANLANRKRMLRNNKIAPQRTLATAKKSVLSKQQSPIITEENKDEEQSSFDKDNQISQNKSISSEKPGNISKSHDNGVNISQKVLRYVSEKIGHLIPSSTPESIEYQQFAIISTGASMEDEAKQTALEDQVDRDLAKIANSETKIEEPNLHEDVEAGK